MLADDSKMILSFVSKLLTGKNYEVGLFENGQELLNYLSSGNSGDIIILDNEMPVKDGMSTLKELKSNEILKKIPVIFLSAITDKEKVVEALQLGADDYIVKPFNNDEFFARLNVHLKIDHMKKELIKNNLLITEKNNEIAKELKVIQSQREKLMEQNTKLLELHKFKNNILGIVAHDLRNPLSFIRGMSELLESGILGAMTDEQLKNVTDIKNVGNNMLALVNDLLDISVIEQGTLELTIKPDSLNNIIEERIKMLKMPAEKKNMTIHFNAVRIPDIPMDAQRITQVVDNLISNAIKYSPLGSNIYVDLKDENKIICFSVRDEGPGISESDITKMFGEFQKLSNRPTGGESSTGLGLAIVKKIIECHNWKLDVKSKVGQGSTFSFFLKAEG